MHANTIRVCVWGGSVAVKELSRDTLREIDPATQSQCRLPEARILFNTSQPPDRVQWLTGELPHSLFGVTESISAHGGGD
jgi:hypothetical protein